jgi:hypothetical protein
MEAVTLKFSLEGGGVRRFKRSTQRFGNVRSCFRFTGLVSLRCAIKALEALRALLSGARSYSQEDRRVC